MQLAAKLIDWFLPVIYLVRYRRDERTRPCRDSGACLRGLLSWGRRGRGGVHGRRQSQNPAKVAPLLSCPPLNRRAFLLTASLATTPQLPSCYRKLIESLELGKGLMASAAIRKPSLTPKRQDSAESLSATDKCPLRTTGVRTTRTTAGYTTAGRNGPGTKHLPRWIADGIREKVIPEVRDP